MSNEIQPNTVILNSFEHVARDWLSANVHTVRDITHNKMIVTKKVVEVFRRLFKVDRPAFDIAGIDALKHMTNLKA